MRYINIKTVILAAFVALTSVSCSEEDLSCTSVLTDRTTEMSDFDLWLKKNYVDEFNIRFQYQYNDKESDMNYNVIPADFEKSRGLAVLIKHMWLDAYVEALGTNFMRTYCPRVMQLTGSYMYSPNGEQVLGTAEGGLKVMLYGVNSLDLDNIFVNTELPYAKRNVTPIDMNYWFFHTMHHEFCHILTQKKEYDTEFRTISAGKFHSADWINIKDENAAKEGFVTGYASKEYNEDFAELYAWYVTMSETGWQNILKAASKDDAEGAEIITRKINMVKSYFLTQWGLDLDEMRAILMRRGQEATTLDLRTLN